jgi:hypothetical protein
VLTHSKPKGRTNDNYHHREHAKRLASHMATFRRYAQQCRVAVAVYRSCPAESVRADLRKRFPLAAIITKASSR